MQTAKQWGAAKIRPEALLAALGQAVGRRESSLAPLDCCCYPELNSSVRNTIHGQTKIFPTAASA